MSSIDAPMKTKSSPAFVACIGKNLRSPRVLTGLPAKTLIDSCCSVVQWESIRYATWSYSTYTSTQVRTCRCVTGSLVLFLVSWFSLPSCMFLQAVSSLSKHSRLTLSLPECRHWNVSNTMQRDDQWLIYVTTFDIYLSYRVRESI